MVPQPLLRTVAILIALLVLWASVRADKAGCAPAKEVSDALAKAQNIVSQELGPKKAGVLLTILKEKAVIVNGEVCFLTKDFADFGRIVAQFFDDHLSNTSRQKSDDDKPSFAQAVGVDVGASSKCSCLNCPSGQESWCPPMQSTPKCCPHLCADIFSTISVGALTGLEGSGVDACCEKSAKECSSIVNARKTVNKPSSPIGSKPQTSQEPARSSNDPPEFRFGVSSATQASPSHVTSVSAASPLSTSETPSLSQMPSNAPSPSPSASSDEDAMFSVTDSKGHEQILPTRLPLAPPEPKALHSRAASNPSLIPSPGFSRMPSYTMPTAAVSPDIPSDFPPGSHEQELHEAGSTRSQALHSETISPTATLSIARQTVGTVVPVVVLPDNTEVPTSLGGAIYNMPGHSIAVTPHIIGGMQPSMPSWSDSVARPTSRKKRSRTRQFGAVPSISPAPSLDSSPAETSSDARGPFTVGSAAERSPPPIFHGIPSPFGDPSPEWDAEIVDDADSPIQFSQPVTMPSPKDITQTVIPVSPSPLVVQIPSSEEGIEDEGLKPSPE